MLEWARRAEAGPYSSRGRARPRRLRQLRAVRGARRGGRRDRADPARDDDRDRPAAPDGAARQAGCVGATRSPEAGSRSVSRSAPVPTTTRPPVSSTAGAGASSPSSSPTCAATSTATASARRATGSSCSSAAAAARRFARMARYADGYAHGGGPPRAFASAAARAEAAWNDLGRPGRPRLWGQGYFALGDVERGNDYLRDYYAFTGPFAERIVGRQPDERARDQGLRARLRGGGLRRARALPDRLGPRRARSADGGARDEGRDRGRRPRRALPGDPAQEGRPGDGGHRAGAERARRHLRLRRRLQRGDARLAARRRSRDAPGDHGHVRALEPRRHPLPRPGAPLAGALVLGDRAQAAAGAAPGALPARSASTCASASRWRRCPRPTWSSRADGANSFVRRHGRVRHEGRAGGQQVRLVRHRPGLRRLHVRLPRDRARPLQRARVPLRRAHEHLHRRVRRADVARGGARRDERGREPRVLRAALRQRPRAAASSSPTARSGSTSRR